MKIGVIVLVVVAVCAGWWSICQQPQPDGDEKRSSEVLLGASGRGAAEARARFHLNLVATVKGIAAQEQTVLRYRQRKALPGAQTPTDKIAAERQLDGDRPLVSATGELSAAEIE